MQDSTVTITVTAVDGATKVFEGIGDAAVSNANKAANAWIKANDVANVSIASAGGSAAAANKAASAHDNLANATRRSYFAQTALTTVLSAGINKAFLTMVDVTGQAIQRVDLLSNFPAAMSALGLSATDATAAVKKLSGYIAEVGGNMQDATTSVTRFAEVTRDVKAATAEYVGVNNALIAGGTSAEVQKNALEQLTQAYSRGIPQLIEWKSILVAMPAQLNLVAQKMGYVNAQALGEGLTKGKVSMQAFMTELTQLSTGTGPIVGQMYARMNGIQFSYNVFKNTLVQGMSEIIQAIGRQNIVSFLNLLTGTVKQLATWARDLISVLFTLFNMISKIFGGPQLKLAADNTKGVADNIGAAADNLDNAANGADGLADGLGNAGKAAAKVAGQLASFDKMNVLQAPADNSGSDGSGSGKTPKAGSGGGAGGLSPEDASALDGIFGDIAAKMQTISTAAKILAGIIASLAGIKFVQGLFNQFNGLIQTIKDTKKNLTDLKNLLVGGTDADGKKIDGIAQKIAKLGDGAKTAGSNIVSGISGAIGGLATRMGTLLAPVVAAISGAMDTLILTISVGLGVSIGVAIAIVIGGIILIVAAIVLIWINWDKIWGFIKVSAKVTWDFIVGVWSAVSTFFVGLWEGVKVVFSAVWAWLQKWGEDIILVLLSPFIFAVAEIIAVVEPIIGFFIGIWNGIVTVFSVVGPWFKDRFTEAWNFIVAVWNVVADWFNLNVWVPIVNLFTPISKWFGDKFSEAWKAIVAVWSAVGGWFNANVWQPIAGLFGGIGSWFGDRFGDAWNRITSLFSGLWAWFRDNVWNPIVNLFSGVGTSIGDAISGAVKGVINTVLRGAIGIVNSFLGLLRGAVNVINDAHIPGVHVSTGGIRDIPIPQLARGGIVDQPTYAQIGENGAEAIVPLENNTQWIDKLASKINGATGSSQPVQIVVQVGEEKIVSKVIDLINERTQMSGRNSIMV